MQPFDEDANARLQEYLRGRERFRRRLVTFIAVLVLSGLILLGAGLYLVGRHAAIAVRLESKGLKVEWFGADGSLWSGGYNEVRYHETPMLVGRTLSRDDFLQLHKLGPVTSIDLSNCFELGDPDLASLGQFDRLTDLRLDRSRPIPGGGQRLTDKILVPISNLKQLKTLSLAGLPITDAAIPAILTLEHLEDLDLDDTRITDTSLPFLAKLPGLRYLRLAGTRVSPEAISTLQRERPRVTVLRVSE